MTGGVPGQDRYAYLRYRLTIYGDDYSTMSAIGEIAALLPEVESDWLVRTDEDLEIARALIRKGRE